MCLASTPDCANYNPNEDSAVAKAAWQVYDTTYASILNKIWSSYDVNVNNIF